MSLNIIEKIKYSVSLNSATKLNRHERRRIAKINHIKKIPSNINLKSKK